MIFVLLFCGQISSLIFSEYSLVVDPNFEIYINSRFLFFSPTFQVVGGGSLDIDVTVLDPAHNIIYSGQRKEYDNVQFNTTVSMNKDE